MRASPVSADDPYTGMHHGPCGQGLGVPIRERGDDRVPLQVREDSAVSLAPPNGPVIYSEYAQGDNGLLRRPPHALQKSLRTPREPHRQCQVLTRPAAEGEADELERGSGPSRTPRVWQCGLAQALSEDAARAARRVAGELASMRLAAGSYAVPW